MNGYVKESDVFMGLKVGMVLKGYGFHALTSLRPEVALGLEVMLASCSSKAMILTSSFSSSIFFW